MYDAARNRGHLSLASWGGAAGYSTHLANKRLKQSIPPQAWEKLAWHREQGHRLVLVTATVAPMAEAMADVLGMDAVYGSGTAGKGRHSLLVPSGDGASLGAKARSPWSWRTLRLTGMTFRNATATETPSQTLWFMALCGHSIAVSPGRTIAAVMLKPTTGPLWIGLREFIYPHAPRRGDWRILMV